MAKAKRRFKESLITEKRTCFSLTAFLCWRERHQKLFNAGLGGLVVVVAVITLLWQRPSIAQKLAAASLDDYFRTDVLEQDQNDADHDGLADDREAELKTDPNRADTDGDGLTDGEEINTYRTNPLVMDTDGDKYPDGTEVLTGHDPNRPYTEVAESSSSPATTTQDLAAQAGVDTLDTVLNGDTQAQSLDLTDFNISDLEDVSSFFGAGNTAEIVVVDSDIKIVDVPENEAKPKIDEYMNQVESLMLEVFKDEVGDPESAKRLVETSISSGDFAKLSTSIQKVQLFSDKLVAIAIPSPAKEFHKNLLKTFLETEALGQSMQRMQSDTLESLVVLDRVQRVDEDLTATQGEFNRLSDRYELGIKMDIATSTTETSTSTSAGTP